MEPVPNGRSNLTVRIVSAAAGIPCVLAVNYVGGWPFAIVLGAAATAGYFELWRMSRAAKSGMSLPIGLAAVSVLAVSSPLVAKPQSLWVGVLVATVVVAGTVSLVQEQGPTSSFQSLITPAAVVYTGLLLSLIGLLRQAPNGAWWVVLLFLVTWSYDTGAYAGGRTIGRHPFMHRISPKKTVEGVVCGLIVSSAVSLIGITTVHLLAWQCLSLGAVGGIMAQAGDLVESSVKRGAGVKDSGAIIPGHGGLLDRIDGMLFVAAVTYYTALATGHAS